MPQIVTRSFGAALAAALLIGTAAPAQEPPRLITVTGSAEVEVPPDLATITAGVEIEAESAANALAEAAAAMAEVLAAISASGVAPADVQTTQLGLDPVWADPPELPQEGGTAQPRVTGYRASNMVTLRLRAVNELGAVVDAVTSAGANRLFGIGFALADPEARRDEARRLAVADARAKAELLAEAAGVTVGQVRSIREGGTGSGPGPFAAREQMAMDMPTAPGSIAVAAEVEVVFALE